MSNSTSPMGVVSKGVGLGCLAGFGLVLLFFAFAGLLYVIGGWLGLAENVRLLLALAGGPTVGTIIVIIGWLVYARVAPVQRS